MGAEIDCDKTSLGGNIMASGRTQHMTVSYRNGGAEIIGVYAVNEEISRELNRRMEKLGGEDLQAWLEIKGCRLDSSSTPAFVWRSADGLTTMEKYYREGRLHREDGPALVWRYANGSTMEKYYRDGKPHREDGLAMVSRHADGTTVVEYFHDGKRHRGNGLAEKSRENRD